MKNKYTWAKAWGVALLVAGLALGAQAQVTPTALVTLTNLPTIIETGATSNTVTYFDLKQGKGFGIAPYFCGTNAGTTVVQFNFQFSADGTNYSTTTPITINPTMNGTTAVRYWTNINPLICNNAIKAKLSSVTNGHTASVFLTNVVITIAN